MFTMFTVLVLYLLNHQQQTLTTAEAVGNVISFAGRNDHFDQMMALEKLTDHQSDSNS